MSTLTKLYRTDMISGRREGGRRGREGERRGREGGRRGREGGRRRRERGRVGEIRKEGEEWKGNNGCKTKRD